MKRSICFVTGTRAEYGLMRRTLAAIRAHRGLELQVVATGMHLDPRGDSLHVIREDGFGPDAMIDWPVGATTPLAQAAATGEAISRFARYFEQERSDVVLVVGDRVEALAAATAAHLGGLFLAHVHGGDRAAGQADDTIRHAISRFSHLHLAATKQSAARLVRSGEDRWRVHQVGSPGIDRIRKDAASASALRAAGLPSRERSFVLLSLHPSDADAAVERERAELLLDRLSAGCDLPIVVVDPNTDPGADGIVAALDAAKGRIVRRRNLARPLFLGLLARAIALVGNSSAGIIEAGSFNTPVLDVGDRQLGRERSKNVVSVPFDARRIDQAWKRMLRAERPNVVNVYGGGDTARVIARLLASVDLSAASRRKLIAY